VNYFSREEWACKGKDCCGGADPLDSIHLSRLNQYRERIGISTKINSGFRCRTHNARVGGAKDSFHVRGLATDIVTKGVKIAEMAKLLKEMDIFGGVIVYPTFIHVDSRDLVGGAKIFLWK
jgi:uncharacterized protein YcbK (DUF882 family)